jgi:hypothetical protein
MRPTYNRFAAKLLFQFRVGPRARSRRRLCEERTVLFRANSPKQALSKAKRAGKAAQLTYVNSDGQTVYFEFVGVMDLLHLGRECNQDEVWYEVKELVKPMERRAKLARSDTELICRGSAIGARRTARR